MEHVEYKYFSPVAGAVVQRYGTPYKLGAQYVHGVGFIINVDEIVPVSMTEFRRYGREYSRCLRDGSLIERTKAEYDKSIGIQEEKSAKSSKPKKSEKPAKGAAKKEESN